MDNPFYQQVQQLIACKVFARTLPMWCLNNNAEISISFIGHGEEVEINLGMEEGATMEMAEDALNRLLATERLMMIEILVQEFRRVGVAAEEINALVEEGEILARRLHPEPELE